MGDESDVELAVRAVCTYTTNCGVGLPVSVLLALAKTLFSQYESGDWRWLDDAVEFARQAGGQLVAAHSKIRRDGYRISGS